MTQCTPASTRPTNRITAGLYQALVILSMSSRRWRAEASRRLSFAHGERDRALAGGSAPGLERRFSRGAPQPPLRLGQASLHACPIGRRRRRPQRITKCGGSASKDERALVLSFRGRKRRGILQALGDGHTISKLSKDRDALIKKRVRLRVVPLPDGHPRELVKRVRNAPPVSESPVDGKRFLVVPLRARVILVVEGHASQRVQAQRFPTLVPELAVDRERLRIEGLRRLIILKRLGDDAQVVERDGHSPLVACRAPDGKTLLVRLARVGMPALIDGDRSQLEQDRRRDVRLFGRPAYREPLRKQSPRPFVFALATREGSGTQQGLCARDGEPRPGRVQGERCLQPPPPLTEVAVDPPESPEGAGQLERPFRPGRTNRPFACQTQVVVLLLQSLEPRRLVAAAQLGLGFLGESQIEADVLIQS